MRIDISTIDNSHLTKVAGTEEYLLKIPLVLYTTESEEGVRLNSIDIDLKQGNERISVAKVHIKNKQGDIQDAPELPVNERSVFLVETEKISADIIKHCLPDNSQDTAEQPLAFYFTCNFFSDKRGEVKIDFLCKAAVKKTTEDGNFMLDFREIKRSARVPLFYNLLLVLFILGMLHLWNGQNSQVFNQNPLFSPKYIAPILSAIALYLGIQFNELRKVSSKLSATRDFMRSTEFYLGSDTVRLFNNRYTSIFLTIFFAVGTYFLLWQFFPVTINKMPNSFQLYAKAHDHYEPVPSGKVYWKDLEDVKVSLDKESEQLNLNHEFIDLATVPKPSFPIFSLLDPRSSALTENKFKLDQYFLDCEPDPFTISEAESRCEEALANDEVENCYCRILTYLKTGSSVNCMVFLDKETMTFTDLNHNPNGVKSMPVEKLATIFHKVKAENYDSFLQESEFDQNYTVKKLGIQLEEAEKDKIEPLKVDASTITQVINDQFAILAKKYTSSEEEFKKILNTIWAFYLYMHTKKGEELATTDFAKVDISETSKRLEVSALGSNTISKYYHQFLLLYRSTLERREDKMELDSILNTRIEAKTAGLFRNRFRTFTEALEMVHSNFDTTLFRNVIDPNLEKLDLSNFQDTKSQKAKIDQALFVSRAIDLEKLRNHNYYKNLIHKKVVTASERIAKEDLDIPHVYLKKLGKYGISPTKEQIAYFEDLICNRWGVGQSYRNKIRAEARGIFKPHDLLVELAEKWDSNAFEEECEAVRQQDVVEEGSEAAVSTSESESD